MNARVAVFNGIPGTFSIDTVEIPPLKPGEVLVKVRACSLCKSDLHTSMGRRNEPTPTILGHEIVGEVVSFSPQTESSSPFITFNNTKLKVGDRISWSLTAGCTNCENCIGDLPQKCSTVHKYGHTKMDTHAPLAGGLASHVILHPHTFIYKIPNSLPDQLACLANCSTATAYAVCEKVPTFQGKSVLIFGAGLLGLTCSAMAKVRGASSITIVDPNQESRIRAKFFGADRTLEHFEQSNTYDVVLELSGAHDACQSSINACKTNAHLIFAGAVAPINPVYINPEMIVRRLLTIHGVHNYHPTFLGPAIEFLVANLTTFPFSRLIHSNYQLNEIETAVKVADQLPGTRIVIVPSAENAITGE